MKLNKSNLTVAISLALFASCTYANEKSLNIEQKIDIDKKRVIAQRHCSSLIMETSFLAQ